MSELRWTLLILGVVFIAALSWWERRRPRQAFAPRLRDASMSHVELPLGDTRRTASAEPGIGAEPWIGEAGLSDVVSSNVTLTDTDDEPAEQSGLHAHAESPMPGPLEELPTLIIPDADECRALEAAWAEPQAEPRLVDPEASLVDAEPSVADAHASPADAEAGLADAQEPTHGALPAGAAEDEASRHTNTHPPQPEPEIFGAEGVGAVRILRSGFEDGAHIEPIVDWPPEQSRRILALRLVAPQTERFPGRTLRLALAAEGFLLGKFAIFHKPDDANRAVLSAASLTRPGAFDLDTMDSQRYGGLSLFAVLPGPKSPARAFEEILTAARNLNERLQGALQDERGNPLTQLRVQSIRESLRAEAAAAPAAPAAAHGA